jgi:hypothetical protein
MGQATAFERTFQNSRQNEQEYLTELDSIRWEIEFLLEFTEEYQSPQPVYPAIEDLKERETQILEALQESELPPIPDELRNPFTKSRTLAQREHIQKLIKDRAKRIRYMPID